jgi:hypothetical protein
MAQILCESIPGRHVYATTVANNYLGNLIYRIAY